MKRRWIGILSVMLAAAALIIAGGLDAAAKAESAPGKVYTDQNGNSFRVVPLGDGRYELWQLVDEQKGSGGETAAGEAECNGSAHAEKRNGREARDPYDDDHLQPVRQDADGGAHDL